MIVVQQIYATYYKDGRGGAQARRRAEMPLGLTLPAWTDRCGYVYHEAKATAPDFELSELPLHTALASPRHARFVRFDDGIRWRASEAGAPPRPDVPIELEGRRWVRLRFNGRTNDSQHDEGSLWTYVDGAVNVGRFDAPPPRDVFVSTEPDHVIDVRAALW